MVRATRRRARFGTVAAVITALAVVAASCGGGDDLSGDNADDKSDVSSVAQTSTSAANETVTPGGTLTYGLEAENATGWNPANSQCPISCQHVFRALYDPLSAFDKDGKVHPYALEKYEQIGDATKWRLTVRSGMKFHDGTPADGKELAATIEEYRCGAISNTAFGEFGGCPIRFDASKPEDPKTNRKPLSTLIDKVEVDPSNPLAVIVSFKLPFGALPDALSTWWFFKASSAADVKNPVGTGPFKFKEWVVNDHMTVVKNPDYWRKDANGVQLPYLDQVTYRPVDDIAARSNGLRSGQFNLMMTSNADEISKFRSEKDNWSIFENDQAAETGHLMLNHTAMYKGKENAVADLRVRQCLAYGTDYAEVNQKRQANITKVADGPYAPGTDGYLDDTGYPKYDPVKAKALCDAYKAEKGITGDLQLDFGTTADPFNKGTNELIATQWKKIGVNATIDQTEQGAYITRGLTGDFQVFGWRNFGGYSQDRNFIWWQSAFALDPPNLALNFGRYKSKVVDDALLQLRTTTDQAARKTAAQTVNKQLATDVANIWLFWTLWAFIGNKNVQNIGGGTLPDGTAAAPSNGLPQHWIGQIWIKK